MSRWGTKVFAKASQLWCNERTLVGWFLIRGIHSSRSEVCSSSSASREERLNSQSCILHFTFSAAVASIYFAQECLIQTDVILRNVFWKRREGRRPASFQRKLWVVRWFWGPTGRRWLFILVSTRGSKTLAAFSVLTELIQALFHSPLQLCQAASTAHLRGFAMPDALRRLVNRRLLCPASLHSQVGFMRGSFEMSCSFEIRKTRSW